MILRSNDWRILNVKKLLLTQLKDGQILLLASGQLLCGLVWPMADINIIIINVRYYYNYYCGINYY